MNVESVLKLGIVIVICKSYILVVIVTIIYSYKDNWIIYILKMYFVSFAVINSNNNACKLYLFIVACQAKAQLSTHYLTCSHRILMWHTGNTLLIYLKYTNESNMFSTVLYTIITDNNRKQNKIIAIEYCHGY